MGGENAQETVTAAEERANDSSSADIGLTCCDMMPPDIPYPGSGSESLPAVRTVFQVGVLKRE